MTAYEWGWLTAVLLTCVVDYALWKRVGSQATLTHLIRRVFAFDGEGRERRLWRVRRCAGALILAALFVHFAGEASGWLIL